MSHEMDELARALASGVSRRQAMKRALFAAVGAFVAAVWPPARARAADAVCTGFCNTIYGAGTAEANSCAMLASRSTGPCYTFGPRSRSCQSATCPTGTICVAINPFYDADDDTHPTYFVGTYQCLPA